MSVYYEKKAKRKVTQRAAEASNEWDDENYDYVLSMEDSFGEHYVIKERIGKGSFGQVVRAHDTRTRSDVAIKIIKSKKPFAIQAQTEIELLRALRAADRDDKQNVVRLIDHLYRATIPVLRSPEVMLGLPYTVAIGAWSLGCILVEMHTGEPLFSGADQLDQMRKLVEVLGMPPESMIEASDKACATSTAPNPACTSPSLGVSTRARGARGAAPPLGPAHEAQGRARAAPLGRA
ncbi:protein kinase [Aureococcus anophagefferens]|nr:protein kinase [Aureococcus anophagefferens]